MAKFTTMMVALELTEEEYAELRRIRAFTRLGTYGAAIRTQMGWPEQPYVRGEENVNSDANSAKKS